MTSSYCLACEGSTRLIGRKSNGSAYVRCEVCDTVQLYPVPTSEELELLYTSEYAQTGHQLPADVLERVRNAPDQFSLKLIVEHCPKGTVLEIGPGHGFFMSRLKENNIECIGFEPSMDYCKLLEEKKLKVEQGFVTDLPAKEWKVAAVYLAHVFEHFNNPSEALSNISSVLAPNGRIVMYQPTAYLGPYLGQIFKWITRSPFIPDLGGWLASPYHICLISPDGMKRLCEKLGLELIAVYPTPTESVTGFRRIAAILMDIVNNLGIKITRRWPFVQCHHFVIGLKN